MKRFGKWTARHSPLVEKDFAKVETNSGKVDIFAKSTNFGTYYRNETVFVRLSALYMRQG